MTFNINKEFAGKNWAEGKKREVALMAKRQKLKELIWAEMQKIGWTKNQPFSPENLLNALRVEYPNLKDRKQASDFLRNNWGSKNGSLRDVISLISTEQENN